MSHMTKINMTNIKHETYKYGDDRKQDSEEISCWK